MSDRDKSEQSVKRPSSSAVTENSDCELGRIVYGKHILIALQILKITETHPLGRLVPFKNL